MVVALHWIIAALVVVQLWLGFTFHRFLPPGPERMEIFTWHKTVGALILLLTLIRLGVAADRIRRRPIPPRNCREWERLAGGVEPPRCSTSC